jgi:hypothetical protein|tara:strand:- start:522 stop:644 length:123 start_codon:yes stop_codon:yes gene_type:complete
MLVLALFVETDEVGLTRLEPGNGNYPKLGFEILVKASNGP